MPIMPAVWRKLFRRYVPILTFPAGLCSRRIDGRVADTQWKTNFLKKVYASQRQVVPLFVEGRLSNFFYRLDRCRKALGVKFNIEMLWLPDEMFSQAGKHFRMVAGEPIAVSELQSLGSLREQTEYIRKKTYFLEKHWHRSPDPVKKSNLSSTICKRNYDKNPSPLPSIGPH